MRTKTPIALLIGWFAITLAPVHAGESSASASVARTTENGGVVSGVVSNQATGNLLPSAVIQVDGTVISTVTERGGTYRLSLPAGTHTLTVSYAGLDTVQVPVSIAAGQALEKNIGLTSTIYQLEGVTVSGVREGNALAIQTQRLADNPKWVAATDTFGNPAANPGELLQRMPGITAEIVGGEVRTLLVRGMGTGFSSLMVDGERVANNSGFSASRDYQIEQLGTANLASVEVIKAPLPDQDANAVAGYVNLVSRRAFDLPGRRITVTGGVMWRKRGFDGSPFKDKPDNLDLIGLAYSDVFSVLGASNNLGIAFNINRRISSTTQDELGPQILQNVGSGYVNATSTNPLQRAWGMGDNGYTPTAYNAGLSADYKVTPDAVVFAKFTYNTNHQPQVAWRNRFGDAAATAANFTPDSTYEHSFMLPHAASVGFSNSNIGFDKDAKSFALSGGTEIKFFQRTLTVNVRGSYSRADISYPGVINVNATTTGTTGIGLEFDRRGQDAWYPIIRQTAGPSLYDPASYNMTSLTRQNYHNPTVLRGVQTDITKKFDTAVPTSIKLGAKYADDERTQDTDLTAWTWVGADGVPNSTDDAMTPYADLIYRQGGGRYGPFPYVTKLSMPEAYWRQTAADAYSSYSTSNSSDAELRETITAGYIQGSMQIGKLRVLGGLRVEKTKTKGTAWVQNTTASWGGNSVGGASLDPATVTANVARAQRSFVRRNTGTGNYRDVFPGLHFVYEAVDGLLFRTSYNRAISRPPIGSLLPTVTENLDANTISKGNPDLKPYHTNNFEVSVEKYFEPVGQFSVGAFLKEISNYSRTLISTVGPEGIDGSGLYANYTLSTTQNVGSARVRGIEASYQQQFSFLPGALKGLGAFANFTYLQAEGNFGSTTTTRLLANLAPRSGNAGINYRYRGLDARVLYNWVGEKYKGTQGGVDVYNQERRLIDVKLQYTIKRDYDVFLDIANITDEPTRTDIALNGLRWYNTKQGVSFSGGIRGRF